MSSTGRVQKWREENPIKYAFGTHKNNAKRRGIPSSLTFEQFKEFAVKVDYMAKKGIYKHSMHIDRIKEDKDIGYNVDNIQPLENGDNIKKSLQFRRRNQDGEAEFKVNTYKQADTSGAPF